MIEIANRKISSQDRPFIIAEMSGNHNQSIERALKSSTLRQNAELMQSKFRLTLQIQ
jgi:sialic acid synthase SpsE